jgi:hypothetical protein
MDNVKRVTILTTQASDESEPPPPSAARAVQNFVGIVMAVAYKPVDIDNLGVTKLTQGLYNALPRRNGSISAKRKRI